jgi:predicted transcriptional regulator
MAKTEFLQIRMTPESSQRLSRVAEADHLDESTWARRAILQALDRWEAMEQRGHPSVGEAASEARRLRKVAEAKPPTATQSRDKRPAPTRAQRPIKRKRGE